MVEYNINEICSIDAIFDFFNKSNYEIEDDRSAFPISELIEKSVEGDAWLIVNHTNLMVIAIRAEKFNQKTYRTKINNYLKELAGMKLIFYTDEFDYYHLTLIYDGFFSIKFKPSDPDMIIVRIFEALESGEDLFDFTKQDINFILLKRELTAKALKDSIKEGENSSVKIVFQDGGLKLIGKGSSKIITAHEDAPVRDLIIDVNLNSDIEQIERAFIDNASELYENYCSRKLKLICMITKKGIIYNWIPYSISGFINYKNPMDEDVMDDVLESLIAQVSYRTAFNSETFHQQFGTHSPFYLLGTNLYKDFLEKELEKIQILYKEWKDRFSKVYQAGDLDQELFIKHTYLALLIKTVLISKFIPKKEEKQIENLNRIIELFEERGVPIFLNDFFQWTNEEINVQNEIFLALSLSEFIIDDLFRTIYQEMVSPATRHALGEFYTPPPLAEKMIEEKYKFGKYTLDPACGSGTFLVQMLKYINNTNKSDEEKIEAISKIYGFDVNPIAVLVARSNMLLLTDRIFGSSKKIQINIFLADSLNPINEFITDIDKTKLFKKSLKTERIKEVKSVISLEKWGASIYGKTERFNMTAINDFLLINIKFFKYADLFGSLLKELDRFISKDLVLKEILEKIYNSLDVGWLNENCEGSSEKTLKDNFEYIAKKFYNLIKEEKNHIWAYLLFNAIGVRKMKETMDGVDLIVGNPPWLTINSIQSYHYKEQVKMYSKELGLYMGGKHSPNTELCSIFFYRCRDLYLKKGGKIFFVTTAAIETGDQHSKFRMFEGFKDILIWKFSTDVFRIHSICVGGINANQPINERLKINTEVFNVKYKNKEWYFELINNEIYVPNNINTILEDNQAKRLIPINDLIDLLPSQESVYKNQFYKGADLFPRNFFFIKKNKKGEIVPDKSLLQHRPWDFYLIEKYDIEEDYIFQVCKSTELVPFTILNYNQCFIPIEKEDLNYNPELIKPKAKYLFNIISEKYNEIQQENEREIVDLWSNINYRNKLSNPLQTSPIKVIYNGQGSILKSAIVLDDIIVDYSLFYIGLEDKDEAYYLYTILNSPCLTRQLEKTANTGASGSIRNIQKRALDVPIPSFNNQEELHLEITKFGKDIEKEINDFIDNLRIEEFNKLKNRVQCIHCQKDYSKKNFDRYRENHQEVCEKVTEQHNWTEDDWIDLGTVSIQNIVLKRMSVQNKIFNNPQIKEKLQDLDKLVISLLKSKKEGD